MTIAEKLGKLRESMTQKGMGAYIIVTDDYHGSESVGSFFKERQFMSGFTGSAGTLVVTKDFAGLWTDGRYFLQAGNQLEGSTIELMRMGQPGVPTIPEFLASELPDGSTVGFDGRTISESFVKQLNGKLSDMGVTYSGDEDLVADIWQDRPSLSAEPVWELDVKYAGLTREEKLSNVRRKMAEEGADTLVLTALDEIAWLLNLRGNDVKYAPVFLAYMIVKMDSATLCVNEKILSDDIRAKLEKLGITIAPYDSIYASIAGEKAGSTLMLDGKSANYRIVNSVPDGVNVVDKRSPVVIMKAVKTPAEMEYIRKAHVKDGVAVTRFIYWLKHNVGGGNITELSAADKLEDFRREMGGFIEPSFNSIIAYGEHGAIVHYSATEETNAVMEPRSFCLADTGGHYDEGSTDITRTIALGELSDEEKRAFTLVLRGHLNLGAAKFVEGTCGANLDILAREPLWENGLDYNHGTGHGVGYLLNVHEGPQSFRWKIPGAEHCELQEGMVISNEPGLYITGKFGIRHENLVLVRNGEMNEYAQFMYLEPLTMVPIDRDGIDASLMSDKEIALLNAYHKKVFDTISPYFEGEELKWLTEVTAEIC
jgi:Xaa-Pro aminopeptidase